MKVYYPYRHFTCQGLNTINSHVLTRTAANGIYPSDYGREISHEELDIFLDEVTTGTA
ncbi:hypothetical protein [Chitinophaga sp. MD30]|uniref:hypothetical protein n=1 Tax=Chitinophaga sp. MD30 TaxID=2033437 RepID=UPI0018DFAE9A|nr:hypothetical protein [Chitinophaga sp. MD30]